MNKDEYEYAKQLCVWMVKEFYPDGSPDWKPLEDTMGVLSQIDNMLAGLKGRVVGITKTKEVVVEVPIAGTVQIVVHVEDEIVDTGNAE